MAVRIDRRLVELFAELAFAVAIRQERFNRAFDACWCD